MDKSPGRPWRSARIRGILGDVQDARCPALRIPHAHAVVRTSVGLPGEYAAVAETKNLKGIIVTCHAPMPDGLRQRHRMAWTQFDEYKAMVREAADEWRGRVDVRLGLESEYVPGYLRLDQKTARSGGVSPRARLGA